MHRKLRNVGSSEASKRYALILINKKSSCTQFMNQFPFSSRVHAAAVNHNGGLSKEPSQLRHLIVQQMMTDNAAYD